MKDKDFRSFDVDEKLIQSVREHFIFSYEQPPTILEQQHSNVVVTPNTFPKLFDCIEYVFNGGEKITVHVNKYQIEKSRTVNVTFIVYDANQEQVLTEVKTMTLKNFHSSFWNELYNLYVNQA